MTPFIRPLDRMIVGTAIVVAILIVAGIGYTTGRHHERHVKDLECSRKAAELVVQRPILRHIVPAGEPCLTLARLRGQ